MTHYKHLPSSVDYREDINGLRAWAVMAVVLFHFSLLGVSGGFVGVDVFFVISGYLMTAIVAKGLLKGDFSLKKFYLARARRILPALLILVAVLLGLGWFVLPTPDYKTLGAQSVDAVSFMSNIYFWMRTGYFDSSAYEKWLLHTWSLSVEWQFYLIYPVLLVMAWKVKATLRSIGLVLGVLFLGSLIASIVTTQTNATAAFYGLHTRAWEMAAGGLVYLIAIQYVLNVRVRHLLLWTGWIGLITTFFVLSNTFKWPGSWAILPVLSAVFILLANQQSSWLTENAIAQWLGDRSYSLYLWHWPLVVLLHFTGLNTDLVWLSSALMLSLLLAHLSYQWIEVPTRKALSKHSVKKEMWLILFATLFIAALAATVQNTAFNNRLDKRVELAASGSMDEDPRRAECHEVTDHNGYKSPHCQYGYSEQIGAILVGDSHAASLVTALQTSAEAKNKNVQLWTMNACPSIKSAIFSSVIQNKPSYACATFNEDVYHRLKSYPKVPVIIANRLSFYLFGTEIPSEAMTKHTPTFYFSEQHKHPDVDYLKEVETNYVDSVCSIAKTNPVFLVRPLPEMLVDVPKNYSRNLIFGKGDQDIKIEQSRYVALNSFVKQIQDRAVSTCSVKVLDPVPYLCDGRFCYGSHEGVSLYYDSNHLSERGNKFLIPMFNKVFE